MSGESNPLSGGMFLEEFFMGEALKAGLAVVGRTGDNPPVGCVIVKDGGIIARGATQPPLARGAARISPHPKKFSPAIQLPYTQGAHAEVMAVCTARTLGASITGADVYVTLEPCAFTGRTPPCSTFLVSLRPRRVLIGIRDPHPQVRGAGVNELRKAGIEVVEGVLKDKVRQAFAMWISRYGDPDSP